jgi:hypothetical protein
LTVTDGKLKVGVALGPLVSVIVGVKVNVGVILAVMVKLGKALAVGIGNRVGVSLAKVVAGSVAGGAAWNGVRAGRLQARMIRFRTRKIKIGFLMFLFYSLFSLLYPA